MKKVYMIFRKIHFVFALSLIWSGIQAQDVHFTRFYDAPTTLNPAKTGDYNGTFRAGGIIRDQNYNLSHIYLTPNVYVDAPIIKGFRDNHWVGVGLTFMMDQAGVAGLKTSSFAGSAAYHIGTNKNMTSYFTIGASYGLVARSVADKSKIIFGDGINNPVPSEDLMSINDEKVNYGDINAGLQYTLGLESGGNVKLGFAMMHLNRPKYSLVTSSASRMPIRMNFYGTADASVNDKIDILPAVYVSTMAGHRDIALQLQGGYKINTLKGYRIIGGLGYRMADAIEILAGMDIKNTRVGVSYDVTTNAIRPTGGFEIAVSHIFMIYKKPKDNPIILCPRI